MEHFRKFLTKYCCCCWCCSHNSSPYRKRGKERQGQKQLLKQGDPASAESSIKSTHHRHSYLPEEQPRNKGVETDHKLRQKNSTQHTGLQQNSQAQHDTRIQRQQYGSRSGNNGSGKYSQSEMRQKKDKNSRGDSEKQNRGKSGRNYLKRESKPENSEEMRNDTDTQTRSDDSQGNSQRCVNRNVSQQTKRPEVQDNFSDADMDQSQKPLIPEPDYPELDMDKSQKPLIPEPDYPELGYIGLINHGLNCCLNSLMQTLFRIDDLHKLLQQHKDSRGLEDPEMNVPHQLYKLFYTMKDKAEGYVSGYSLINCLMKNGIQANEELDADELLRQIFSVLKQQLDDNSKLALLELFTLSAEDFMRFVPCGHHEVEQTRLLTIPVPFLQPNDLPYQSVEEALKVFFRIQNLGSDNMVYCQKCKKTATAYQECRVLAYPPIVCLHLKRFTLDYNTGRPKKLYDYMPFPQEINFWSFHGQHADCPEKEQLHSLFSVVVHSGNASSGHFLVYTRNQDENSWHRINDTYVDTVSWKDVQKTFGNANNNNSETAYLLFYKRTRVEMSAL